MNLYYLSHLQYQSIYDITPFEEVKFSTPLEFAQGYLKINLKDAKDKNNLYIQFGIRRRYTSQYFIVDVCSFSEEPTESDIYTFKDSVNDIKGTHNSDSNYNYYIYKIPKFESMNWLVIRIQNTYSPLSFNSIYVYSEKETSPDLAWNIVITVISALNFVVLVFILFQIFTLKRKLSSQSMSNKLTAIE